MAISIIGYLCLFSVIVLSTDAGLFSYFILVTFFRRCPLRILPFKTKTQQLYDFTIYKMVHCSIIFPIVTYVTVSKIVVYLDSFNFLNKFIIFR